MAQRLLSREKTNQLIQAFGDPFDVSSPTLTKLFANFKKTGIQYYPDDMIVIGPNDSPFVKENSTTTVGIFIANKYIFEDLKIFGYVNKTLDGKLIGKINDQLAIALMEDDITMDQMFRYIDRTQFLFGGTLAHIINTSLSSTLLNLPQSSKNLKAKLLKDHADAIAAGDPLVPANIETQVTDDALEHMRKANDPAMALFDSGCGIDPYNNYKTMFVMKGAIIDNTGESPTGYKTVISDYDNGISKEDMPKIADSLVTGAYSRGVSTQDAGYSAKKYNNMYQRTTLAPRGSDCGTTDTEDVLITEANASKYGMYRFIMENGKPVRLTPKTINKYIGKTVKLRTPSKCKYPEPEFCNICFGDRPYMIGSRNVGLQFNIATGSMMNASLKKFHDVRVRTYCLDIEKDLLRYKPWE